MNIPSLFQTTMTKSSEWITEVMAQLAIDDERKGLRALRAGLHTIRDTMPLAEAVDLGAQLPMLLCGLYYKGWRLADRPVRVHNRDELFDMVRKELAGDTTLAPEAVLRAVIRVLAWHVSGGELDDIAATVPRPLADLWNDSLA